jgi:hypothetical protein
MATSTTKLYASQGNGGSAGVSIAQVGAIIGSSGVPAASTTTAGIVKQAAHIANAAVPFADLTAAANAYNALLAAMQTAGQMA